MAPKKYYKESLVSQKYLGEVSFNFIQFMFLTLSCLKDRSVSAWILIFAYFWRHIEDSAGIALEKMLLDEQELWLGSAVEIFWKALLPQCLCLKASLGSYLSAETNGVAVRHLIPFLLPQTWADSHFWELILLQRHFHCKINGF